MGLGGEWRALWVLPSSPTLGHPIIPFDGFDLCLLRETFSHYLVLDHFAFRAERILAGSDLGTRSRLGLSLYKGTAMSQSISLNSQNRYEIKISGQPDAAWLGWFGDAKTHVELLVDSSSVTTFSNVIMDQAGLVGLIRRLHGIGIVLLSIQQV